MQITCRLELLFYLEKEISMIEVCYHTTRGASMARCFYDVASAHSFIVGLRKHARIFVQGNGERKQIGGIEKSDKRWRWYYDYEAAEQSVQTRRL